MINKFCFLCSIAECNETRTEFREQVRWQCDAASGRASKQYGDGYDGQHGFGHTHDDNKC